MIAATPMGLTDKNLYAYCDNNPVLRTDNGGYFWDTVFDVISLVGSIVDVIENPKSPMAWISLVGDAVDLIPGVTCVGETLKGLKIGKKAVDAVDDVKDAAKTVDNIMDTAQSVGKAGTGSKIQEVLTLADNYKLSDDVFSNHILARHGANSTYGNKSHFMNDFNIKGAIDSTLRGDNFIVRPNTNGRAGYIFEQTFSYQIGTSSRGKSLHTMKVVIDEMGNVVTAFPKS